MRVDGPRIEQVAMEKPEAKAKPEAAAATSAKEGDVVVSSQASRIAQAAGDDQNARAAHLDAIRTKLESGQYKVDYQKLAERMVDENVGLEK